MSNRKKTCMTSDNLRLETIHIFWDFKFHNEMGFKTNLLFHHNLIDMCNKTISQMKEDLYSGSPSLTYKCILDKSC